MFWDSSALVSALLSDTHSSELIGAFARDPTPAIWWTTPVECRSAVVRAVREKRASRDDATEAMERLREARSQTREVLPVEAVRTRAIRLLVQHPLRAAETLQLAAALIWCEEQPLSETFVCLDQRLRDAARRRRIHAAAGRVIELAWVGDRRSRTLRPGKQRSLLPCAARVD